jgi:hypothetical protein
MSSDRSRFFKVEPLEKRLLLSATPAIDLPETDSSPEVVDTVVVEDLSIMSAAPSAFMVVAAPLLEVTTSSATLTPDVKIENDGILVAAPVTIASGETWLYRSTGGSVYFTEDASVDGSDITTQENLIIDSAQDVYFSAHIGIINPVHHLVVSAGQNVVFEKNIFLTGDLVIEAGASVVFQGSVRVGGSLQIGDSEDLSAIGSVQFQINALLEVGGIVEIYTDGNVSFNANVGGSTQPQAITVDSNSTVSFNAETNADVLSVCALNIAVTSSIQVDGNGITSDPLQLMATNSLALGSVSSLTVDDGGMILSANLMSFDGGPGSIASIGSASNLVVKPYDASRIIGVAGASGNQLTRLELSSADLAAIDGSFNSVVIGDALNGTGEVRIGAIGLTQSGSSAQVLNPTTFVGGSILVEGPIDASAETLRLVALQGDILINGEINATVTERSATVRLEAEGDIVVARAVYSTDLISLSAGYTNGVGNVIINHTGLNSGSLATSSDSGPEGRIEVASGDTSGDVVFNGTGLDLLISVFGTDGELALRARGGAVTQTDGLIEATVLAVVSKVDVTLRTRVTRVGNVVFGGEALRSGLDEVIDGIRIVDSTGILTLVESDDLILDYVTTAGGDVNITTVAGGGGDLRLGILDAAEGDFILEADGAIIDELAGSNTVNLATSGAANLTARLGIGASSDGDIDTDVGSLSAVNAVSGGIYIQERGALSVTGVGVLTEAGDGNIALTVQGALTVEDAAAVRAHGGGHVLLDSESTLTVGNTFVGSTSGILTVLADGLITLQANASLATATAGSILLRSRTDGLVMDATASVVATDTDIRIETVFSAVIGQLTADNIALVSGASVTAAAGVLTNITAINLRVEAANSAGAVSERLRTAVATLAVDANGIFVSQSGDLQIATVAPVEVDTFAADGSVSAVTDLDPLSDLVADSGGDIVVVVNDGELILDDGVDADGISVHALGGGSVYLETATATESIDARASVLVDAGALSVRSGGALTLGVDVLFQSVGGASIVLDALAGDLSMAGASAVVDGAGAVVLNASGDIHLAALLADQLQVTSQEGMILNASDAVLNVLAAEVSLSARDGLGVADRHLTVEVDSFAAEVTGAGSAGIFVAEKSSVLLESVTVAGERFGASGGLTVFSGTLANVIAASGEIELSAQTNLEVDGTVRVETLEASATLHLTAKDGTLTMQDGALVRSNNGNVELLAELTAALSIVDAQGGDIVVVSEQGAIVDNLLAETPNLISSGSARLEAATGIGAVGAADLNTNLGELSAQNSDSGLIVISEVDDLTVSELSNLGSDGSIIVQSVGGSMVLTGATFAANGGIVLLRAAGADSDLTINDTITAEAGAISLEATRHLNVNAAVEALAQGTLDFLTVEGDIVFSSVGRAIALNQNIRIEAGGDAVLTGVDAGTADVSVIATAVLDAGDAVRDIVGTGLRVIAAGNVGQPNALDLDVDALAVRALSGEVNLSNLSDLRIGIVDTVPIDRVLLDGTTTVITDTSKISDLLAGYDVSVVSENGSVEVRELSPDEVAFGGDSVESDQPSNAIVVDYAATPTVSDTIRQIGGFGVSLEPSTDYTGPAFTGGAQVVYFDAAGDYGTVAAGVQNALTSDFIRLEAVKPEAFPLVQAAHLNAFVAFETPRMITSDIGSISMVTAGEMLADTEIRVMLETEDGRFYLSEQTMNGNAASQTLTMPSIDSALWAEFSPDTDGDWRGDYDSLTFDQPLDSFEVVVSLGVFSSRSVAATELDVSSVLTVRSFDVGVRETLRQDIAIDSVDGVITLTAADDIFQNASIRTENGAQISLNAEGGLIRMDDGVLTSGSVADIAYEANGNVELSTLQSGSGTISVVAGDRITDNRLTDDVNLITPALVTLSAVNGIGVFGSSDILTDIGSLTATNTESGDIVIRERDGLVIAPAGVSTLIGDSSVIITAEEGDFTVNGDVSVSGAGRLLLNALGTSAAADLTVNASIETASGSVSLLARNDLSFSDSGSATVLSGAGTLDLQAIDGMLTMGAASVLQSNAGNIRLLSQEAVTLGIVDARSNAARAAGTLDDQGAWGDLSVRSVNSGIQDARDRTDESTAIYANAARFLAIAGIGETGVGIDNSIDLEAALLAASAADGVINIVEASAVVVGSVDALSVDRVDTDATVFSVSDLDSLAGLTTSGLVDGAVIMRTIDGTLVIEDIVSAAGNGAMLLQASGAGSDVLLNANVLSTSGPISVQAEDAIVLDSSVLIQTGGAGSVDVFAVGGSVEMADTSRVLSSAGSLRIEAGGDILLSNAESLAEVALISGGSILDNGDTHRDVVAAGLLVQAGVGAGTLGSGANPLEVATDTLSARAGAGGINLLESNALSVGQLQVDVLRVAGDASMATESTGEQAGVVTTQGNGSIVIRLSDGNLALSHTPLMTDQVAVAAHGDGNVLLETLGSFTDIGLSGGIETGGGNVTLVATSAVSLGAATQVAVNGAGDVAIFTGFGGVRMDGTSRVTSTTGHIRLSSSGDILLGGIETLGTVSLITLGASVLNNSSTQINVTADALRLQARVNLGALVPFGLTPVIPLKTDVNTLSARSELGNITVEEVDGLTIDDVGITVSRVGANAQTSTVSDAVQSDVRTQYNNRHIVIRALEGDIVLNEGSTGSLGAALSDNTSVAVVGNGRLLIEALTGDVLANANISGVAGDLSIIAGETIRFAGNANLVTGNNAFSTGTLYVEAINGSVEQLDGSQLIATLGDIRVAAGDSIRLANVTTTANVSLIADEGSIVDLGDTHIDVSAAQLRLMAGQGIGLPTNALDIDVDVYAARAGGGGIFLDGAGAFLIGDASVTVRRYNPDNSTTDISDESLSDVRTISGDGSIVLRSLEGDLILNDGSAPADNQVVSAHGAGNIRLEALSANADALVNADVVSTSGHITLLASRDVRFATGADLTTGEVGTINVEAGSGLIEMDDQTKFSTGSGDLRLSASGNILLGGIETTGNVALTSETGSVLENGDFYTDVVATGLRVTAEIGIGSLNALDLNPIKTRVDVLSARATSGGINILEETGLTVDDVAVTVQLVGTDAAGTPMTEATQSDVRTTDGNGSIVLRTQAGDIILNDGTVLDDLSAGLDDISVSAHGSGNILIEAIGVASGIEANADLLSTTGHISLVAHSDITLTDSADVVTSGNGTLLLDAQNGDIEQADNSRLVAVNGDIRVWAMDSIVLGGITTDAKVSLVAQQGSISAAGDSFGGEDVIAMGLRMEAGLGIGSPTDLIETRVDLLSARATSGGIFIEETDELMIDGVDASVERVQANAETTTETDSMQSDVRTTAGNGSIVIRTLAGHLSMNDGANPSDNTAVSAHGSGNIRLEAAGAGTDLLANADILSGSGHITLLAQRDLLLIADADVTTGTDGTIRVVASDGSVEMADDSLISSLSGDIQIQGGDSILVGGISTTGNVSLIATNGSVLDNGNTYTDVVADGLYINAGLGVGELGIGTANAIDTQVSTVTARAGAGGVNLLEADALSVGSVEVIVQSVGTNAELTPSVDSEQTGIYTTSGNGAIVLQTLAGDLSLDDGSGTGSGAAVSANGSGNLLVQTLGDATAINLNSALLSGTGHITLISASDVFLSDGSTVTTGGNGAIFIEASAGDFSQFGSSLITSVDGAIRVLASENIDVVGITTGADTSLIATTGSITGSTTVDQVDIGAAGLRLVAGSGVGSAGALGHALDTMVDSVSARTNSGDLRIQNTGDLEVAAVAVTVQKVDNTGESSVVTDAAQNDLINANGSSLLVEVLEGGLTTQGAVTLSGTGPVRLAASDVISIHSTVTSADGDVTLYGGLDISLIAASNVQVGGSGSIYIESDTGGFVMVDAARLVADSGNIRVSAVADLTLGEISTFGDVSLISTAGVVLSIGSTSRDVTAHTLRIEAVSAGTSADPLQVEIDELAAHVGAGGIYLEDQSMLLVGELGLNTDKVLIDGSIESVTDTALAGVVAEDGPIVLSALFDLTLSSMLTGQSADLTSHYGAILKAGAAGPDVQVSELLTLSAEGGIGRSGTGELVLDAATLELTNQSGSVYLSVVDSIELAGVSMDGSGNLYLNQALGDMSITSPLSVANGRAVINAFGALLVEADVSTGRDLRVVADSLTVTDSQFVAGRGDIVIRTSGNTLFDATSRASATNGTIGIVSGGTLSVADFEASSQIDLRATGDILQSGGLLTAPAVRLFSETGDLGESDNPMMTNAGRIDMFSDGNIYISEADSIQIGRSGISNGGDGVDDTVTLNIGSGTLSSATESIEFDGEGTLILNSNGELVLGTLVRATNGNVTINADGLRDGTIAEGLLLEVRNGRVSIVTANGVGGPDTSDIEIAAEELTATTQTGDLELEVEGSTRVVEDGLYILGGSGNLVVDSTSGALNVDAPISHGGSGSLYITLNDGNLIHNSLITQNGSGDLFVNVLNGSVSMSDLSRIETNSGLLDFRASGLITLSRITTQSGNIYLESTSDSIRRLSGFSGANIISLSRSTVNVAKIAEFTVDSSSVRLNGGVIFRGSNQTYILIAANFS